MSEDNIKAQIAEVMLVSLRARRKFLRGFILNRELRNIEIPAIDAQIAALKKLVREE